MVRVNNLKPGRSSTRGYIPPPTGKSQSNRNGLVCHCCTKCKRNSSHGSSACRSTKSTVCNKAKSYVASLKCEVKSDLDSVTSVESWGIGIDNPPQPTIRRSGKVKARGTNKRKTQIPPLSNSYSVSNTSGHESAISESE